MDGTPRHSLEMLHARSWEMELLLSGFVLVLLLPLPTYVEEKGLFLVFSFSFLAIFLILAFFIALFAFVGITITLQQAVALFPGDHWLAQSLDTLQTVIAIAVAVLAGLLLVDPDVLT